MPHASGGGSFGGGGFRSGCYGRVFLGTRYYAGSRIPIKDRNDGTDRYLGSASLAKTNKNFARSIVITTIIALFVNFFLGVGLRLSATKLDSSEYLLPVISDDAGVIADKTELDGLLNEYRELTGIVPVVYTVYEEDWKATGANSLSQYALYKYMALTSDERHFVIVYSVPKDNTSNANKTAAVQGNETDDIITTAMYWKFLGTVKLGTLKGDDPGKALCSAFSFAVKDANVKLNPTLGNKLLTLFDNIPLMISLLAFLVIYIVLITRYVKERKAGFEKLRNDPRLQ